MKTKTAFVCQQCGQTYSKWLGRCQECGEWNCVIEEIIAQSSSKQNTLTTSKPVALSETQLTDVPRIHSPITELDNVLGGGLVLGSVTLVGGEPGIGKSTLLLQAANHYAELGKKVLYASGEESAQQIGLRARRMSVGSSGLYILSESRVEAILKHAEDMRPSIVVIDSIQTAQTERLESQPGGVGQLRECTGTIVEFAKRTDTSCLLVGHVTKDGNIAGPKVLEHLVDTVLYFEGLSSHTFRILRSIKNRFGPTHEIGVFEMNARGLSEVRNPSAYFISEKPALTPGSVVSSAIEGSRALLVEIQALVARSFLTIPRRTALGLDSNRLSLLIAVLEKRAGLTLYDQDVFANVAGGFRLTETATDLAVVAALLSSHTGKCPEPQSIFLGEVGLGGEVRNVPRMEMRLKEAAKMGFTSAFCPKKAVDELRSDPAICELRSIEHVEQLKDYF